VQYYRSSKGNIINSRNAKISAAKARERFEFRQVRLDKAEQAREVKREARRIATEKAKTSSSSAADIINAANLRAKARQASPDQQKAKLERSLMAAKMRLDEAQERLAEANKSGSAEQQAQQHASVEGARQKVEQTKRRLEEVIR
jgi:electron transport complex protein RnfC